MQLEEGEISDISEEGSIGPYIPLERPILHYEHSTGRIENNFTSMEEESTSSYQPKLPKLINSESESEDDAVGSKKIKLSEPVKKKYCIWNRDPDEDLTDFLHKVGMDEKPRPENCRNVENYPLPNFSKNSRFRSAYSPPNSRNSFQEQMEDEGAVKYSKKRKVPHNQHTFKKAKSKVKKQIRNLSPLEVDESNTIEEVAEDITKKLMEYNKELILRIVIVLGKQKAIQFYEKTKVIEKLGGMLIANGSRRRTSGGVFIFLVRSDKNLSNTQLDAIFVKSEHEEVTKPKKKSKGRKHGNEKKTNRSVTSELSNPPPSPDLPDLPTRKDTITELEDLEQESVLLIFRKKDI